MVHIHVAMSSSSVDHLAKIYKKLEGRETNFFLALIAKLCTVQLMSKLILACTEHKCILQFLSGDSVQTHV